MPRKTLPIAVLPLDPLGASVVSEFRAVIERAEPALIETGWLCTLPTWAAERADDIFRSVQALATVPTVFGDAAYESVAAPTVLLFAIGSLGQHSDSLLANLEQSASALAKEPFGEQVRVQAVVDVSRFVGDPPEESGEGLPRLSQLLRQMNWREYVYLADNRSPAGVQCDCREQIQEAIGLFLEAITLGQHWDGFAHSWLNTPPQGTPPRYAGFSVLSLQSLQFDLARYLEHVSFYQLHDWLSADPDDDEQAGMVLPQVERLAYQSETGENPPAFRGPRLPAILEPKSVFWTALRRAKDEAVAQFVAWQASLTPELYRCRDILRGDSPRAVDAFQESVQHNLEATLSGPHFLHKAEGVRKALSRVVPDAQHGQETVPQEVMPDSEGVEEVLFRAYQPVARLVRILPNQPSLVIQVLLVFLVQVFVTSRLLLYWRENRLVGQVLFGLTIVLWLAGLVYLSYRVPSWRIGHLLRGRVANQYRTLVQQVQAALSSFFAILTAHWNVKIERGAVRTARQLYHNISLSLKYLEYVAARERSEYPYSVKQADGDQTDPNLGINWDRFALRSGRFRLALEAADELPEIAGRLHRSLDTIGDEVVTKSDTLEHLVATGQALELEATLRQTIHAVYGDTTVVRPQELASRIQRAAHSQKGLCTRPLLNPVSTGDWPETGLICARHPAWLGPLQEALGESQLSGVRMVGLTPQDRLYFLRVHYDIPAQALEGSPDE